MISVTAKLKTYSVLLSVLSVLSVITIVQAVSATSVTTLFSPLPVYLIPDDPALNMDRNWLFPVRNEQRILSQETNKLSYFLQHNQLQLSCSTLLSKK
jgi:hypothetical protein